MPYIPIYYRGQKRLGCGGLLLAVILGIIIYLIVEAMLPNTDMIIQQFKGKF